MKKFVLFLVAFSLAFTVSCKKKPEGDAIKVGIIGPMNFLPGQCQWKGATMAAEEINENGGIKVDGKARPVEVIKYDSNEFLSITDATNAMQRAVNKDKVDFLMGGARTEAVLAMQEIAADHKKIFFSCGAADDKLCLRVKENYERYKGFFRITPFNSSTLGKYMFTQYGYAVAVVGKTLGLKPKVAIVGEKAAWVEPILGAAKFVLAKKMGLEIVGVWRPSANATDMTAELSAIQRSGAHMIFTIFSSSGGVTFIKQANELKIPVVIGGLNTEATNPQFGKIHGKGGDYVITMVTYCDGTAYNELTQPFLDKYKDKYGEMPAYTSDTYAALITLKEDIEAVGLGYDAIIKRREETTYKVPNGLWIYDKETHEYKDGPGINTGMGIQWKDGKMNAYWPNKWVAKPGMEPYSLPNMKPLQLPPWMVEAYKKK